MRNAVDGVIDLRKDAALAGELEFASAELPKDIDRFIFLHIPRTAGSAFSRILYLWYAPGNVYDTFSADEAFVYPVLQGFVSQQRVLTERCVHVHVPYPVQQSVAGDLPYLTIFRNPVERVISQYKIVYEATSAGLHSFMGRASGSLREYLDAYPQYTCNLQAKFILNMAYYTCDVEKTCERIVTGHPEILVRDCMRIINEKFIFFGIAEQWDATILALSVRSGRTEIPLTGDFMSSVLSYVASDEDIQYILEYNQLDILLYKEMTKIFNLKYASLVRFLERNSLPAFNAINMNCALYENLRVFSAPVADEPAAGSLAPVADEPAAGFDPPQLQLAAIEIIRQREARALETSEMAHVLEHLVGKAEAAASDITRSHEQYIAAEQRTQLLQVELNEMQVHLRDLLLTHSKERSDLEQEVAIVKQQNDALTARLEELVDERRLASSSLRADFEQLRAQNGASFHKVNMLLEVVVRRGFRPSAPVRLFRKLIRLTKSRKFAAAYFDETFYTNMYLDVLAGPYDPYDHFVRFGAREGRSPNPMFDSTWYVQSNSDVLLTEGTALGHFLTEGCREGRRPHPLHSAEEFRAKYMID